MHEQHVIYKTANGPVFRCDTQGQIFPATVGIKNMACPDCQVPLVWAEIEENSLFMVGRQYVLKAKVRFSLDKWLFDNPNRHVWAITYDLCKEGLAEQMTMAADVYVTEQEGTGIKLSSVEV